MIMDWYTKNELWLYWKRGDDEEVLTYDEFSDLEEEICGKKEEKESGEDAWSNYLPNDENRAGINNDNDAIQANQEWYVVPTSRVVVPTGRSQQDMNIWKVIQNGNSLKRTGRDRDGRVIILPLTTADEHIAVQRGSKARTNTLCYHSIPDDHATELLSFDDCNNKLKTLSIYQGYSTFSSSQSAGQGHSAFVSTARASKKMTYEDSPIYSEDRVSQILIEKRSGGDGHEMAMAYHLVRVQQFGAEAGEGILILIRRNLLVQQEEGPIFVMMMVVILEDAIEEGVAKIYNLITGADTKEASTAGDAGEFALMGVTSEWTSLRGHTNDILPPVIPSDQIFKAQSQMIQPPVHNSSESTSESEAKIESQYELQEFQGGKMTFRGGEGRITGKGTIRTPTLDFKNVYYGLKLHTFNLFSIARLCDQKNRDFLFIDTDCLCYPRTPCIQMKEWMVKAIRCDNGTEFKNAHIIELCGSKGIKRDYSNARTPQQNGVAERKNRTLIEAARTMLADSKLPTMFWTEAVRTACYVLNRVLVTSPHNKTPYALLTGNIPSVSHFKPFGCHVTILNTSDHLGKFDGKADEGYIIGYSASNKAYRVYNVPNKRVEETMNLRYLEEKPNVQGLGHEWYFDLDYLTDTLGYKRDKANQSAGTHEDSPNPAGTQDADSDSECDEQVIIIPSYPSHSIQEAEPKDISSDEVDDSPLDSAEEIFQKELARLKGQEQRATSVAKDTEELQKRASTKSVPPGSIPVPTGSIQIPSGDTTISPASTVEVSPVATKRINTIHPQSLILGDHTSAVQTRSKVNKTTTGESAFISYIHDQQRDKSYDFQHTPVCLFLSQFEPRSVSQALELSKLGLMLCKKRCKHSSSSNDMVMDVKSAFLYGRIDKEVYVTQLKGFVDHHNIPEGLQGIKALYGLIKHQELAQRNITCTSLCDEVIFDLQRRLGVMNLRLDEGGEIEIISACSRRLISWQCKKQTIVATSSTKAEYVAAANCCGQVLWIQNQLLDYGSPELGPLAILATIDATPYTITEDSVRVQLQLADDGGKLTFYKNKFSPQWRFLVHTILHCLSTKSGSWDQFGSPIAVALICLSDRRKFNWSSYIFKGMTNDAPFTSTNVDDEPLGGSFHAFPPRSTQASPVGHTSGGAEDPISLTALSAVVSTLVQKVKFFGTEFPTQAHKNI
ncbi:putative ribonuclease H-like domain-containing protein [Tanacetum coccineum]